MKRNYIIPSITVKTFSNSVQTAVETSAVKQAKQSFDNTTLVKVREVLVMEK